MRRAAGRRALLVSAVVLTAAVGLTVPAHAGPEQDGLWYYTATGMATLHERSTGKGIQVAVIDTAIQPAAADLVGTDLTVHEPSYCAVETLGEPYPAVNDTAVAAHGTGKTSLIIGTGAGGVLGVAPDATVYFYATSIPPAGQEEGKCAAIDTVGEARCMRGPSTRRSPTAPTSSPLDEHGVAR
ncbi:S8 family serine peptidase [Cellulomonas soli]